MVRPFLAAGVLATALAAAPLSAQESQPQQSPSPPAQTETGKALVGLPVFSSDGQKLGEVIEVGEVAGGQKAVRAEMGDFLGLGSTAVLIASDMFQTKDDRVEIAMTAAEVKDAISKQRQRNKD
jgi:PRC-barrel domain